MGKKLWRAAFVAQSVTFVVYLAASWLYVCYLLNGFDWISERGEPACSCLFGGVYDCDGSLDSSSTLSASGDAQYYCPTPPPCPPCERCPAPTPVPACPEPTPVPACPDPTPAPAWPSGPSGYVCPIEQGESPMAQSLNEATFCNELFAAQSGSETVHYSSIIAAGVAQFAY